MVSLEVETMTCLPRSRLEDIVPVGPIPLLHPEPVMPQVVQLAIYPRDLRPEGRLVGEVGGQQARSAGEQRAVRAPEVDLIEKIFLG